jgi:hypothetical protein
MSELENIIENEDKWNEAKESSNTFSETREKLNEIQNEIANDPTNQELKNEAKVLEDKSNFESKVVLENLSSALGEDSKVIQDAIDTGNYDNVPRFKKLFDLFNENINKLVDSTLKENNEQGKPLNDASNSKKAILAKYGYKVLMIALVAGGIYATIKLLSDAMSGCYKIDNCSYDISKLNCGITSDKCNCNNAVDTNSLIPKSCGTAPCHKCNNKDNTQYVYAWKSFNVADIVGIIPSVIEKIIDDAGNTANIFTKFLNGIITYLPYIIIVGIVIFLLTFLRK